MLDCWTTDPTTRPTFNDLAGRIGDLLLNDAKSVSSMLFIFNRILNENSIEIILIFLPIALRESKRGLCQNKPYQITFV